MPGISVCLGRHTWILLIAHREGYLDECTARASSYAWTMAASRIIPNMCTSYLPILYYHSVADHTKPHFWAFLSTRRSIFIRQMEFLSRKGFATVHWHDLLGHLRGETPLPKRPVMIHFDDGFLDNWSVVFPIMERLRLKYSVVVSTDFIDPGTSVRPFVSETSSGNEKDWWGYLNRAEMREMEFSGLVDVQSHAKTHTWYETGPTVVGRHGEPNGLAPWLHWNRWPGRKYAWLTHNWAADIPVGTPILQHAKSLQAKRFFPSAEYIDLLCNGKNHVEAARILGEERRLGRYESDEELDSRLKDELVTSKRTLEDILNKKIIGLVWPGGGSSWLALETAKQAGYGLVSKGKGLNGFGHQVYQIRRLAGTLSFQGDQLGLGQVVFLRLQLVRGISPRFDCLASLVKTIWR